MTIDAAGQRANDGGPELTKAAKRAARKIQDKIDGKRRTGKVLNFIADAWDFVLRNQLLWLALAVWIAGGVWEWWNSARGWQKLYPGAGAFAYIGAAGAVGLWFLSVRRAREEFRKDDRANGAIWVTVAVAMYVVSVCGVLVAVASNSVVAVNAAKASRVEYARMVQEKDKLAAKLELANVDFFDAQIAELQGTLASMISTAKGAYGLDDLDVDGACATELKFYPRRQCIYANGGLDPQTGKPIPGIRAEITRAKGSRAQAEKDQIELNRQTKAVKDYVVKGGDETADAVGAMFDGTGWKGDSLMGWIFFALSSCLLYGGGWLGDWVLERIEAQRTAAKQRRAVKVT